MVTYEESLDLYRSHRFMKGNTQEEYRYDTSEDDILLDVLRAQQDTRVFITVEALVRNGMLELRREIWEETFENHLR